MDKETLGWLFHNLTPTTLAAVMADLYDRPADDPKIQATYYAAKSALEANVGKEEARGLIDAAMAVA